MKDITDYFSSPTKTKKPPELIENVECTQKSSDQNVNMENKSNELKTTKNEPKRNKKKRRRKPTDPEVKTVTELLSNNLSLVSPNTSGKILVNSPSPLKHTTKKTKRSSLGNNIQGEEKSRNCRSDSKEIVNIQDSYHTLNESSKAECPRDSKKVIKNIQESDELTVNNIIEMRGVETNTETPKDSLKVDAFQFLMNSRNNIIGQNSDGKVADEEDNISEPKSKLATRKELFKNWADQKGALKRKREDQERDKCITYKMEKRAKRLKNLVQGKAEEKHYKKVKNSKSPVKSKRVVKILSSSESENSNDVIKSESSKENNSSPSFSNISEVIEENAQDVNLISSQPPKKHNSQNNLLNFFGILCNEDKEERIEVFDDTLREPAKKLIKIKMFTPESTKKRTSLLSLNRERTKSITDESSQESDKTKKHKKNKKKSKDVKEKSQNEDKLNDSLEDFCSPEKKKSKAGAKKSNKKEILTKNGFRDDAKKKCDSKEGALKKHKINQSDGGRGMPSEIKVNYDIKDLECPVQTTKNIDMIAVDESSGGSDIIQSRKRKGTKQCIADDSDDSRSSENQKVLTVDKTKQGYSQELNISVDKDIALGKFEPEEKQLKKEPCKDSTVKTPRTKRKNNKKHDNNEDNSDDKDSLIQEKPIKTGDPETAGRVLRPKRNNLNYNDFFQDHSEKKPKGEKSSVKKTNKPSNKDESIEKVEVSSDSDYEEAPDKKLKVPLKVAPVFLKATPKPKIDPEVMEARKKFLLSGVPESLKIAVEKQRSIEEKEYDIFPSISHIQQKCQSKFWNLPSPDLTFAKVSPFNIKEHPVQDLIIRKTPYEINIVTETEKIKNIKFMLDKIKADNPSYPVYKVFRHIYEKSGKNFLKKEIKSPRRRSKKTTRKSSEPVKPSKPETVLKDFEMWSEKYKPRSSEEILGNHNGVNTLKNWLQTWMNYSEEINARVKRKKADSNSESEFESTDCDSRDSTRLPGNTIILGGPCGSGKTSAVYAVANELGFNVLELNASSKRTGKRLIQELQEATQSHQVRKNENNALSNYINSDKSAKTELKNKKLELKNKKPEQDEKSDKKKMCILLVEDIDVVFDQDEGFLTSLSQLITTSKRPIILTTNDNSPLHVQKLLSQYECISFMPLSLQCLGIWLQILCLVEGLLVDKDDLGNLLEYNKGDIRKTLLEVQFWSQSGGQLEKNRVFPLKVECSLNTDNSDVRVTDEELQIDFNEKNPQRNLFIHKHCIGSFEIFRDNKEYCIPLRLHLGILWWNMPNILEIPSCATERLHRQKGHREDNQEVTNDDDTNEGNKLKLNSLLCLYDSIILTDSLFKTINCHQSNEPVVKNWLTDVRDSIELTERTDDQERYLDMIHELTDTLIHGCIENYRCIDETNCRLNMAMPDSHERRWRAKQHICEDFLKEPIPLSNTLDRSSIALDYLPSLRDIARYENKRAALNTKRGNRFRHYLKNLNMDFKESTCKLACNILNVTDD